jgi:hypothetical protein
MFDIEELAMNVKLKADKEICFWDIETAAKLQTTIRLSST